MSKDELLYKKIKAKILNDIKGLSPNERIPSRTTLAEKYGVTRTTIERAISELVGEGILYSKDGSGTYVTEQTKTISTENVGTIHWGVILPNILLDTYPEILRGIEDVASENSITTQICNTDNDPDKQERYLNNMIKNRVNGIIIVPSIIEGDNKIFKELRKQGIPVVFCNRTISGIQAPKVISNNFYGSYLATKHLIEQGYKKIAFIGGISYSISIERYQGYLSALSDCGIDYEEKYVYFEEPSITSVENDKVNKIGYEVVKKLLTLDTPPDAFFCFDDLIAQGAYFAIHEAGFKVGEDIGLIGYNDNSYICNSIPGELSSIDFKAYNVGHSAAKLLLSIIKGESIPLCKTVVIQPVLKVRGSSSKLTKLNKV